MYFVAIIKLHSLPSYLVLTRKKSQDMKRLAMMLAVVFTMGLTASTVSASTVKDDTKKEKKECCSKDKKDASTEKKTEKK